MESGRWMNKFRALTMALIFSGALNVGLLTTLIVSAVDDQAIPVAKITERQADPVLPANQQLLQAMSKLSFAELVTYLTNKEKVGEGYAKRDLALSTLVAVHYFDLARALPSARIQRRLVALGPEQKIEMYPSLTEEQYSAIVRFAYQEKWPITAQGLFQQIKKRPRDSRDETLAQAFFHTAEFHLLNQLFQKTGAPQESLALLDLLCDGPWELIERFTHEQSATPDMSLSARRSLLLGYLSHRSSQAAKLLLQTDALFAKICFEDESIIALLAVLPEKTPEAQQFCKDLLRSARGDAVLRIAAERLYRFAGETPPVPLDLKAALARFSMESPQGAPVANIPLAAAFQSQNKFKEHIVKEGETLWKIARQYGVKIDELMTANAIEKERLFPGMTLRIPDPQGTGSEPPR